MKIGYARVSTADQELGRQIESLKKAGCEKIYEEHASGKLKSRPQLDEMLLSLREDDVVVIQKLDRLGRSLQNLLQLVETFKTMKVGLVSLTDNFDTTSSQGKLIFNIMGAIASFERDLISERTKDGLRYARSKGVRLGKRPGLNKESMNKARAAEVMFRKEKKSVVEICRELNMSRATFYRYKNLRF